MLLYGETTNFLNILDVIFRELSITFNNRPAILGTPSLVYVEDGQISSFYYQIRD